MTLLLIAGYCALVALATAAIDRLAPRSSRLVLVLGPSLPVPLLIAAAALYFITSIGPPAPDEIDAGGMAAMAFMIMGTIGAGTLFAIGLVVSYPVARYLRAP